MRHGFRLKIFFSSLVLFILLLNYGGCESSDGNNEPDTATPIKRLVIIDMENSSFDRVFAT